METGRLWPRDETLILASQSEGRRLALTQTGVRFEIAPANIDERSIQSAIIANGGGADAVVARLAQEKAIAVSKARPGKLTIGADQLASCEGRILGKSATMAEAAAALRFLSGRTHRLHSAVALARDGVPRFSGVAHADLKMRVLSDAFIDAYLAEIGEAALSSAGGYQIEGLGIHLFDEIVGDHSTILGLPLIPLLAALRREGVLL